MLLGDVAMALTARPLPTSFSLVPPCIHAAQAPSPPTCDSPNPCRNGVLLGDVALALTGKPLPASFSLAPRDIKAARRNLLLGLEHLGLLMGLSREDLQRLAAGKQVRS